jgi:hypothetical protein
MNQMHSLMFIPCVIRRIGKDQQYALTCTTPLFYVLAPRCFSSSLPSSGSFLDPPELLKIQIEWVVCHIMCGYVTCVSECHGSVSCISQLSAICTQLGDTIDWTMAIQQTGHVTTHYMIHHSFSLSFQLTQEVVISSLMMAGYCQNM